MKTIEDVIFKHTGSYSKTDVKIEDLSLFIDDVIECYKKTSTDSIFGVLDEITSKTIRPDYYSYEDCDDCQEFYEDLIYELGKRL